MQLTLLLYIIALFYVLTPGVLVSLPRKGSKMVVALTHAVIFALVFQFTYKLVLNIVSRFEGFKLLPKPEPRAPLKGAKPEPPMLKGAKPSPITKPFKM